MRICTFVLGILLIAGVSFAHEVDGTWSGEMQNQNRFGGMGGGMGGPGGGPGGGASVRKLTFGFKADGEVLTGYTIPQGMNFQAPIREGIIKGNKIWYLVDVNFGQTKMVIRYKGKIKGDKIKLSFKTVSENQTFAMPEQQVTLTRQ